jgi:hypothetical protein
MAAMFPQDQLGLLVRSHIEEQTKRFDSTEELLRQKRDDLRSAEFLSAQLHDNVRSRDSSVQSTVGQNASLMQGRSTLPQYSTGAVRAPSEFSFVSPAQEEPPKSSSYEMHRALCDAVETSPMVLSLQHTILRLENNLSHMHERQEKSEARIRFLEDEKETMRLELQALSNLCMVHSSVVAELRQALVSLSNGPTSLNELHQSSSSVETDCRIADLRDTQALLTTALQEDTFTAAALVGVRSAPDGSKASKKETVCDQCFSRALCSACGNCGSEWYCSANCALLRREKHRPACEMLRGR